MKKLSFIVALTLFVIFSTGAAFADKEKMPGAWQIAEPCAISQDAMDAFKEATAILGVSYEPLYLVATQVVNGMQYLFIAKQTLVTASPVENVVKLIIYKEAGAGGKAVIRPDSIAPLL